MDLETWIEARIEYIKGLKAPSNTQRLIIHLYHRSPLTDTETKQLNTLLSLERINERKENASTAKIPKTIRTLKKENHRASTSELKELGSIVELLHFEKDKGLLAGALLYILDQFKQDESQDFKMSLKQRGDKLLLAQQEARQAKRKNKLTS
ncbi:MAG: hypothetical protein V4525_13730 [Pseudomonadota bacterium]